uniref:Uncharacterized protein n=1 Tax=Myotis lucifugus TaxID=59463 RepID=G1PZT0_MYOLU
MMMRHLKMNACSYSYMESLWETKESVKESSSQSKKFSHTWTSGLESARSNSNRNKRQEQIGKGEKIRAGEGQTELTDQGRARVANRSINQITLGRLQRRRKNRINGMQGHGKKKNAKRGMERIKMLRGRPSVKSTQVTVHDLGKEAVLLGGTAEVPGFKWKPAEPQAMGVFQKECWNAYQVLQEQLGSKTHTETQPVYERAVPAQQILAFSEQKSTPNWKMATELLLPESQSLISFQCAQILAPGQDFQLVGKIQVTLCFERCISRDIERTFISTGLKLKNDTGNDPPMSTSTLEIQTSGCKVLRKARMKVAQKTTDKENHGGTHKVRKRPRAFLVKKRKKLSTCKQELPKHMDLHGKG